MRGIVFAGSRGGVPAVTAQRVLGALWAAESLGYDDRGNWRVRRTIETIDLTVALYVLLLSDEDEAAIDRTEELGPNIHVDLDDAGRVVGVEFLHPRSRGLDTAPVRERYGIDLEIPFSFAA